MSPTRPHAIGRQSLAVLSFVTVLFGCACDVRRSSDSVGAPVTSNNPFGAMAVGGPEVWMIDGKPFQIRATYLIVVNGRLQFTVDYLCAEGCPEFVGMSDEKAFSVAYPIMKHVVTHGLYARTTVQKFGGEPLKTELIGVAITQQTGGGKERGYRVARTVEQIRAAIQAKGPGTQDARP